MTLTVVRDYTEPRLLTGRHPRAVGSYGPRVRKWAEARAGLHLRPTAGLRRWQRVTLDRALEHDAAGRLVWSTVVLSAPRQVGKSFLERMVCDWRIHAGDLFGEPQDVLHLAHKLVAAQEVWRPAARFAVREGDRVRWANGEQQIETPDGSRWMVQAANDGAGVAFSLSMVLVDEAWRVHRHVVDAALGPTMAESASPQLWLVSTAGTSASDLMRSYRAIGIDDLEPSEDSSLCLLEWSAPPDDQLDIDDPQVWREASPYWDDRRLERMKKARGEVDEWQFRQQWLNQWIPALSAPLFDALAWQANAWRGAFPSGPLAFGADIAPDRSRAIIVGYVGGVAEVVDDRPGASWVASRLVELVSRWSPVGIGLDGTGPAATVAADLAGVESVAPILVVLNGREMATGSGAIFDAINSGELVATRESVALAAAVANAKRRPYGQSWTFVRDDTGTALCALVAARWAAEHSAVIVEESQIWV